eukprot:m.75148 g.75148  ORF g.75148 m.75148 type:complete len:497 (-) comp11833_c0_seq1:163-1653(-)
MTYRGGGLYNMHSFEFEDEDDLPEFVDEDGTFDVVGSDLLGGAPMPKMNAKERQKYYDGVAIKAKYIGSLDVPTATGDATTLAAIDRVRQVHKSSKEAKHRRWIVMSVCGLQVKDFETRRLIDSYPLHHISYTTTLKSNPKVFAFVSVATSTGEPVFTCHVYKSHTKAKLITYTLGLCFTLALELQRAGKRQSVPIKKLTFSETVHAISTKLDDAGIPPDITYYINEGLKRLTDLYRERGVAIDEGRGKLLSLQKQLDVSRSSHGSTNRSHQQNHQRRMESTPRRSSNVNPDPFVPVQRIQRQQHQHQQQQHGYSQGQFQSRSRSNASGLQRPEQIQRQRQQNKSLSSHAQLRQHQSERRTQMQNSQMRNDIQYQPVNAQQRHSQAVYKDVSGVENSPTRTHNVNLQRRSSGLALEGNVVRADFYEQSEDEDIGYMDIESEVDPTNNPFASSSSMQQQQHQQQQQHLHLQHHEDQRRSVSPAMKLQGGLWNEFENK